MQTDLDVLDNDVVELEVLGSISIIRKIEWGCIIGDIFKQTDLKDILDSKLSETEIDDILSNYRTAKEQDIIDNSKANNIKDGTGLNSLVQKANSGVENIASGDYSIAFGRKNSVTKNYAFAGGNESKAEVQGSFVYGQGLRTSPNAGNNQVVLGRYNSDNKDAVFILGIGNSNDGRKNAFEILSNGIKIGKNTLLESDVLILEKITNKVNSISSFSTHTEYPSAKAVYDYIQEVIPPVYDGGIE